MFRRLRLPVGLGLLAWAAFAIGFGSGCGGALGGTGGGGTTGGGAGGSDSGGAAGDGSLSCDTPSVENACSALPSAPAPGGTCEPTWSAALTNKGICPGAGVLRAGEYDCGSYHVLLEYGVDFGFSLYYDGTSGALVAIVSNVNGAAKCLGGPSTGFAPPICGIPPLLSPPQCIADGGSEGGAPG